MEIIMQAVKETPGTVLFKELDRSNGKARNIYVPKDDWQELGEPGRIRVTIETV